VFRRIIQFFLDPWIIFGAIGFGVALLLATFLLLSWTRSSQTLLGAPTAVITVIAVPATTPILPTPTPIETEPPPATDFPPPAPGDIALEAYVKVVGTGGDGLRLRTGPGLDRDVRLLAIEDEVFLVQDGPQQIDGYSWWYLVGPFDDSRHGWAVANFLRVVQNP
jgi:hypothetical protein